MGTGSNRLTVSVRIAGHEYRIRGEGDEEGLVRIAGYVDRAMERVRARTGTVDSLDVAVLTCLNLAREILAIHEQRTGEADEVRIRSLIDRVEAVLDRGVAETRFRPAGNHSSVPSEGNSLARTLDLSSVEDLNDRRPSSVPIDGSGSDEVSPRAVAAAGGRDRVG